MQGLPSWLQGFNLQLVELIERFLILFLRCPFPGVQLWFHPHLCMWSTHRSLVLRLPWSSWVCPIEDRAQRWYNCLDHRSPGNVKCTGKPAVTGTRDITLVRSFSGARHKVSEGQYWPGFSSAQPQTREGQPWEGFFYCPSAGAGVWGERGYNSGSSPCVWLSSSALLPCCRFPPSHPLSPSPHSQ